MYTRRRFHAASALSLLTFIAACDSPPGQSEIEESEHALLTTQADASWVLGGVLHVVKGTTAYKQTIATGVWSPPENLATSWSGTNAPFAGSSAPIDAAFQTGTAATANLVVFRGSTKFERGSGGWMRPVNMTSDPAWNVENAPFQSLTASVDASLMIGDNTLYVFRGTTLFSRFNGAWMPVTSNLPNTSWGSSANRPFFQTTAPLDTAHYDPVNRRATYVRGMQAFVSPFTAAPVDLNTATQWAASNGPLDPAIGSFTITAAPTTPAVVWGEATTIVVTVKSANGFNGQVNLSLSLLTTGLSGTFSPAQVTVQPFGTVSSTLTLTSTALGTKPRNARVTIKGTAGPDTSSTDVDVSVRRVPGAFVSAMPLVNTNGTCGPVMATVGVLGGLPTVSFQSSSSPAFNTFGLNSSGFYKFAPNCKFSLLMGRATAGTFGWSLYNTGVPSGVFAAAPGNAVVSDAGPNAQLQTAFFSPDSSLFAVTYPGGGSPVVALFDAVSGVSLGSRSFNTSVTGLKLVGSTVTATFGGGQTATWTVN